MASHKQVRSDRASCSSERSVLSAQDVTYKVMHKEAATAILLNNMQSLLFKQSDKPFDLPSETQLEHDPFLLSAKFLVALPNASLMHPYKPVTK